MSKRCSSSSSCRRRSQSDCYTAGLGCKLLETHKHIYHSEYLNGKEAHGGEAHPRVEAVEIGDGRLGQVVRVKHRDEAHADGRNGQDVEKSVEELLVNLAATSVRTVRQKSCRKIRKINTTEPHTKVVMLKRRIKAPGIKEYSINVEKVCCFLLGRPPAKTYRCRPGRQSRQS